MRDPQNRSPSWYCSKCGAEQYESDAEYVEDGRSYCEDCFRDRVMEILHDSPGLVASCLGMRRSV